ncbi:MAG: hypothetical protein ACTSVI_06195 [Promethearchaeota archaeon]
MITCPHGFINESECPECSKMMNVKPLLLANRKGFVNLASNQEPKDGKEQANEQSKFLAAEAKRLISIEPLVPRRLFSTKSLEIPSIDNSRYLHSRLRALRTSGDSFLPLELNMAPEDNITHLEKSKMNLKVRTKQ